jgi:hypothetical protein
MPGRKGRKGHVNGVENRVSFLINTQRGPTRMENAFAFRNLYPCYPPLIACPYI